MFLGVAQAEEIVRSPSSSLSIKELENGIADRLKRVEEFKFIEEEAAHLGVRAWLFGGTAAGYAHYVKWDMQRERGDKRFQKDRFDYDYTNIYRSTQDLDIVIDGKPEQANKLQQALQLKYPHLLGSKTAWEVRLLTQDMGDKQAILNNPDFMNQHTDSNSTGLIEITKPRPGEHVVRDVRDWNSKEPYFLKDVHDGMLHYYFSPLHQTTRFYKEGRNPPIFSAIRFLTKAFQYELKIRPDELAQIKKIIQDFDPKDTAKHDYIAKWIERNGKKLIQNAVNIEYAKNTLDQLGLREKLQSIQGDVGTTDSLAWWMNKEPLRSHPIGQGTGKTAKELGLDIVAHETNNFLAYESITRAHTGDPNVLISRERVAGEAAYYGNGFYAKTGKEGARGTGLTIRFHLDPHAREGHDFEYLKEPDFVIVKNKAALKVIPESLDLEPLEYFGMLARNEAGVDASDRGIFEKFKRRMGAKLSALSKKELSPILTLVEKEIFSGLAFHKSSQQGIAFSPLLAEWFAMPVSANYPDLARVLFDSYPMQNDIIQHFTSFFKGQANPAFWVDGRLADHVLSQPHWRNHPELVTLLLKRGAADDRLTKNVLSQAHWISSPHWKTWVEGLIAKDDYQIDQEIMRNVLSRPGAERYPELVRKLMSKDGLERDIVAHVLSQSNWSAHPQLIDEIMEKEHGGNFGIPAHILSKSHWKNHPEWVEKLLEDESEHRFIVRFVLYEPHWKDHPEWVIRLIKEGKMDRYLMGGMFFPEAPPLLTLPHWRDNPELRRMAGGAEPTIANLREAIQRGEWVRGSHSGSGACVSNRLMEALK
jgi:hypothetical protein